MTLDKCFILHNVLLNQGFKGVGLIIVGVSSPLILLMKSKWLSRSILSTRFYSILILILIAPWKVWVLPPSRVVSVWIRVVVVLSVIIAHIVDWGMISRTTIKQMSFSIINTWCLSNFVDSCWNNGHILYHILSIRLLRLIMLSRHLHCKLLLFFLL